MPTKKKAVQKKEKPTPPPAPQEARPDETDAMTVYVLRPTILALKRLALRLSEERGRRVTQKDLVGEALADLLIKYAEKKGGERRGGR
jgi:hypothetical protein